MAEMVDHGLQGAPAPAITTAPHPRDVAHRLELRQNDIATCGWVSARSSLGITCPVGNVCAQNTAYNAAFCCSAALYPYCGVFPTTCLDSTEISSRCTGACLYNDAVIKCQSPGRAYCATKVFSQSTVAGFVTGYDCSSTRQVVTAYDYYVQGGSTVAAGAGAQPSEAFGSFSLSGSSAAPTGSSSPSTTTTSSKKGGSAISGGAIAGIVIGVLAAIVIALAMFFVFRYMRKRQDHNHKLNQPPPQPPMSTGPTTSYVSGPPPTGPSSGPSSQHPFLPQSPTPLTQQSLSQQNAMSEVTPADSASQVGGFYGSHVSQNVEQQHAQFAAGTGSAGTGPHSSLGALPEFQNQNPGIYGRHGPQSSVMSPGSAFDSLPGVRPPDVASAHPHQSPPLQQQSYAPPSSPPLPQQQQQGYPQQQQQYAPPSSPPPQQQQGYPPQQQQYAPPSSPPPPQQPQQPQGYPQPQQQPQGYPQPQQQPQGYPQPQQQYHTPADGRVEMGS